MIAALSFAVLASALATPPPFFAKPPNLSTPALCSTASAAPEKKRPKPKPPGGLPTKATCTADCGPLNAPVSCHGNNSCTAVDQGASCPMSPGYVQCDSQDPVFCPACCSNGQFRSVSTGDVCGCPDGQSTPHEEYECVDGVWEYQYSFCDAPFCIGW
jgi:hypothetical protein